MAECWGCGAMFEGHSTQHFCIACKRFASAIAPVTVRTGQPSYVSDEEEERILSVLGSLDVASARKKLRRALATRKVLLEALECALAEGVDYDHQKLSELASQVRNGIPCPEPALHQAGYPHPCRVRKGE